ncbi:hypothetical protein PX699_11755 [Sphingobium sp. H39-3-25]|nr:hypothetical protein [Sphingobium arseniciresistens]
MGFALMRQFVAMFRGLAAVFYEAGITGCFGVSARAVGFRTRMA